MGQARTRGPQHADGGAPHRQVRKRQSRRIANHRTLLVIIVEPNKAALLIDRRDSGFTKRCLTCPSG